MAEHTIVKTERPYLPAWGFRCSCGEARSGPYPHKVDGWIAAHLAAVAASEK